MSEWNSARRPTQTKINSEMLGSYVGHYRLSDQCCTAIAYGVAAIPDGAASCHVHHSGHLSGGIRVPVASDSFRKRFLILGCTVLVGVASAAIFAMTSSRERGADFRPGIGIRGDEDRIFAQLIGSWPVDEWGTIRCSVIASCHW